MVMKRCNNGHFYDNSKHSTCPYCNISKEESLKTVSIDQAYQGAGSVARTAPRVGVTVAIGSDEGKTVGVYHVKKGIDPVVGWVVCIEGASKGQDYRIKSERNFIGRDQSMDISISGDKSISREKHAIISYSPKTNGFMLIPGESHGIVYLNNEEIYAPVELKRGDIIELGETKLMFIPVCDDSFQW
ncbi:MAG: FHA domain-containing protein [Clostridia bacterium]|nr:FHA domain-containing protein [Clostridia bacterium]